MKTYRANAIIVGILYIMGTVAGTLSLANMPVAEEGSNLLSAVTANENQVIIGSIFILVMGLSLSMVPVVMYPILKKHNEILALGYVVFRGALETVSYFFSTLSWLFLLPLSHAYIEGDVQLEEFAKVLLMGEEISLITTTVFCIGATMFYTVLFRSKLVPRWLSAWGLIGVIPYLASVWFALFGIVEPLSTPYILMNIPLAIQEMVLALWLIFRGFNPAALSFDPAKANA